MKGGVTTELLIKRNVNNVQPEYIVEPGYIVEVFTLL